VTDEPGPPEPASPAPGSAPPGWYPTPQGVPRWWDGSRWGPWGTPPAPAPAPVPATLRGTENAKALVVLSHLGCVLGGFILPLVIFLVEKRDPFVRHHAAEALNFQLAVLLVVVLSIPLMLVLIGFLTLLAASVGSVVFGIVGAVKASQGQWWRYPLSIRFVKP
jgi:uncharacterized Tic20 family protein